MTDSMIEQVKAALAGHVNSVAAQCPHRFRVTRPFTHNSEGASATFAQCVINKLAEHGLNFKAVDHGTVERLWWWAEIENNS